jgi:probable HAF family extracellular repeat protein
MAYTFISLDDPSAVHGTEAFGINNLGQIVGDWIDAAGHRHGFLLDNGTYTTIDNLSKSNGSNSLNFSDTSLQAINDQGVIAGYEITQSGGNQSAFIFSGGTFMGAVGAQSADGINNLNHFVGWYTDMFTSGHPVRGLYATGGPNSNLNNGGEIALNVPAATATFAHGINNQDTVIGNFLDSNGISHEFTYLNGTYLHWEAPGIDVSPSFSSAPIAPTFGEDINDLNQSVGYYLPDNLNARGYFLDPGATFANIDFPGAKQTFAYGLNNAGQIVGDYIDSSGNTHGFLAFVTPPPTNNDVWLLSNGQWSASVDPGRYPGGAQAVASGDFNHDGTSDVLWFNASTGDAEVWLMASGKWAGGVDIGAHPAGWQIGGTGDFNGDHNSDVLWFNPGSGQDRHLAARQWPMDRERQRRRASGRLPGRRRR